MGIFNKIIKEISKKIDETGITIQNNRSKIVCHSCGSIQKEPTRYCCDCGAEIGKINNDYDDVPIMNSKEKQDYTKAIFLYANSSSEIKSNTDYVRYLTYECGLLNPQKYHKELIEQGYYRLADIAEILNNYKVDELKNISKNSNLKVAGKKLELINRIKEEAPEEVINKIKSYKQIYVLSEKGKKFLDENRDYIKIHTHPSWQITIDDYLKAKKQSNSYSSFNDLAWGIFNHRTIEYSKNRQYGLVRNNFYNMYQLLKEEEKNERALEMLIMVIIYDLSGVSTVELLELYKQGIYDKDQLLDSYSNIFLAPGIIKAISDLEPFYTEKLARDVYKKVFLPINFCSENLLIEFMNDLYNNTIFDYDKYIDKVNLERINYLKKI